MSTGSNAATAVVGSVALALGALQSVQKNSLALTASLYIAGSYVFKQESNELNVKLGAVIN